MNKIGRNDPCPCGSGRKYKKCCLADSGGFSTYTQEDKSAALQKLEHFVEQKGWEGFEDESLGVFYGDPGENHPWLEENKYISEMSKIMFDFWFYFDLRADDNRTVFDYFLDTDPSLSQEERTYLGLAARSCVRLYEVTKVIPGKSVTAMDVIGKTCTEIREISGSRSLKRHDLFAARIIPVGASGRPEIDGGFYLFPRMQRDEIVSRIEFLYDMFFQDNPGTPETEFYKELPPIYHQLWLKTYGSSVPKNVKTSDGHEMVISHVYFDVDDPDALIAVLDGKKDLDRPTDDLYWTWLSKSKGGKKHIYGGFQLDGRRLILETTSRERAKKGQTKIKRIAGDLARYRLTEYTSLQSAMQEYLSKEPDPKPEINFDDLSPADREKLDRAVQEKNKAYYKEWLDMDIPRLDGCTPRQAARSRDLKPRIIEMLKDLEYMYETELKNGNPGFDPHWLWDELGLTKEHPDYRETDFPPLTGAEAMAALVIGIEEAARKIAAAYRKSDDFDDSMTLGREDLSLNLDFQRFVREQTALAVENGMDRQAAQENGNLLARHLEYMVNYELHLRKTFWIEESLSYMLGQTRLDLAGEMLKMPYAAFALVFTDRFTLEIAERILSKIPDCVMSGRKLHILTVYVTQVPDSEGSDGLKIAFTFDAFIEQWPYLLVRELTIDPDDHLEQILASHIRTGGPDQMASVFESELMRQLIHLVINAILYTTSADVATETRTSPQKTQSRGSRGFTPGPEDTAYLSSRDVIFLPGKIDISHVKQLQAVEKSQTGRGLMVKFMVRGHWRRASPKWKDQRPRWIRPYWKGPDLATVIERQYRLKS